jgi:DNA polymerase-1
MTQGKLVVIDGNSLLYRAFFALPPLTTADGTPTNAVYGFTMMVLRVLEDERPEILLIAQERGRTFRHEQFDAYKAHRPKTPPDLVVQAKLAREVAEALRIPQLEVTGFEADDLVGTIACRGKAAGYEVLIVTGDLDALQLVDERVKVMVNRRGITETVVYDPEAVRARFGLEPAQLPDFKALRGDPSDNIPGVPGIGEKTAARLIAEYGSLEKLAERAEQLPPSRVREALLEHRQKALQYKGLATIITDVPVETPLDSWRYAGPDPVRARDLFTRLEFRTLLAKLPAAGPESEETPQGATVTCRRPETDEEVEEFAARVRKQGRAAMRLRLEGGKGRRSTLAGAGVADEQEALCFGPAGQEGEGLLADGEDGWELPKPLRGLIEDSRVGVAGYDLKSDLHALARIGVSVATPAFDVMLAAYVLNPGRSSYRLEDLAQEYLGVGIGEGTDPVERAGREAVLVARLWPRMDARVRSDGLEEVLYGLEMPLVPILAEMEACGVLVDVAALRELSARLATQIAELEAEIFRLAGHEFNVGSPRQLQTVLFEEMGLQAGKRTRTGQASTSMDVLEELAVDQPMARKILEHRELAKLKSTYADSLPGMRDPETGRVHTSLNQTVAATGRLSSSDPNLQNIPIRSETGREIRKAFVAPAGRLLLSADYSQIELRILAHETRDPELQRAFREDEDVHTTTASRIFGVDAGAVTPELRRRGKTLNFSVIYGMSDYGLSRSLGIPVKQAHELIEAYFARFPQVRSFTHATIRQARELGYVTTLPPFRRRRYIPGIAAGNRNERLNAERAAVNAPIQGTAADIIKRAMIQVRAAMRRQKLDSRMLLQVHDELLFEVAPGEREAMADLVRREMCGAGSLEVPLRVDLRIGKNWRDAAADGNGTGGPE